MGYHIIHLYRMFHEINHPFWGNVVKTISISEIRMGSVEQIRHQPRSRGRFLISQDFTELQEANGGFRP